MEQNIKFLDDNLLAEINNLDLSEKEIEAIYYYLALFEDSMSDEEKVLWSFILEKKDPEYDSYDEEEDEDNDD